MSRSEKIGSTVAITVVAGSDPLRPPARHLGFFPRSSRYFRSGALMTKKLALDQLRRISKTRPSAKPQDEADSAQRRIVPDLPKRDDG